MAKKESTSSLEESGELVSSSDWDDSLDPYGKYRGSSITSYFEKGTQLIVRDQNDKVTFSKFFMHEEFKDGKEEERGK